MSRISRIARVAAASALIVVLVLAVAALAGASPGKGKPGAREAGRRPNRLPRSTSTARRR